MEEENANLSFREIAIRTRAMLHKRGILSPVTENLYATRLNTRTMFFYSSEDKREAHVSKLLAEYPEANLEFIDPVKH